MDNALDHSLNLGSLILDDGIIGTTQSEGDDGPLMLLETIDPTDNLCNLKFSHDSSGSNLPGREQFSRIIPELTCPFDAPFSQDR